MKTVILNDGLGVDSSAILFEVLENPSARKKLGIAPDFGNLIVVTAMTGNEWPDTGRLNRMHTLPRLAEHKIRYVQLARTAPGSEKKFRVLSDTRTPSELHMEGAYKLSDEMRDAATIPTSGGFRKCSLKFKGEVIDAWLAEELAGAPFAQIMGFNSEEEGRAEKDRNAESKFGKLRHPRYPLIEWNWNRKKCEAFLEETVGEPWAKSACFFCPFAKDHLLPRFRMFPALGVDALRMEYRALAFNPRMKLYATKTVRDVLTAGGLGSIVQWFEAQRKQEPMALYRVRRVFLGKTNAPRSIEKLKEGSRAVLARALGEYGTPQTDEHGISRVTVRTLDKSSFPAVEELIVISPADTPEKVGRGFAKAWARAQEEGTISALTLCGNETCKEGPRKTRKRFQPAKKWARYCGRSCGDRARMRAYYERKKTAAV